MGLSDTQTLQGFPVSAIDLYNAALEVLPAAGFQIAGKDPMTCRIQAKAGMSALSWGEDVTLAISESGTGSVVEVRSALKVGFNLGGAAQNTKNAERIIGAISAYLQNPSASPQRRAELAAEAAPSNSSWGIGIAIVVGVIILVIIGAQ